MKRMLKAVLAVTVLLLAVSTAAVFAEGRKEAPAAEGAQAQAADLVYGYVSPGPDTWYKRAEDGFRWAGQILGIETVVLNSEYDVQKEVDNIASLITQGVDGFGMFSFNQQGAVVAAQRANEANIPIVTVDNVGQVLQPQYDVEVVAAIDFDWAGMGRNYADYMAENHPGAKIAVISGILEHVPVQAINTAMKQRVEELGQNEIVTIVDGEYNPTVAVNRAQDLVESGQEFDILWVMDEDMAAAVIRYLESQNLLDRYTVIAQNGSPAGIPLVQQGQLDYTISSSPGWEGMVAFLALHHYVTTAGAGVEMDRQIMLPVIPVTEATINYPTKVVPWEPHRVWIDLTKQYFPELGRYLPEASQVQLPR